MVLVEIVVEIVDVEEMEILVDKMLTIRTFPNLETVRTKDLLLWFLVQWMNHRFVIIVINRVMYVQIVLSIKTIWIVAKYLVVLDPVVLDLIVVVDSLEEMLEDRRWIT
jgi:hypothetical protein